MATARDLIEALGKQSHFEAVDLQESAGQIRIMGRVPTDGTNANLTNWLLVVDNVLERLAATKCAWTTDISKSYFRKGGKLVFAWRLLFQAPGADIRTFIPDIISFISAAPKTSHVTVDEVPLVGASPNRNALNRGKGAGSVLNAPPIASLAGGRFSGGS